MRRYAAPRLRAKNGRLRGGGAAAAILENAALTFLPPSILSCGQEFQNTEKVSTDSWEIAIRASDPMSDSNVII